MVKTVVRIDLPVDEKLFIKKNTLSPNDFFESSENGAEQNSAEKSSSQKSQNQKRLSVVTGIHGDELEGQLVCFEIQKRIAEHPEFLTGTVDIYPALNPLGIESNSRMIPSFEIDMNETFPGITDGTMVENISLNLMNDLCDSDFVIDIHASSIFVREIPQVRMPLEFKDSLIEKSKLLNMDLIWAYNGSSVQENSLAYALNKEGTPAVVIDMGIAETCTPSYSEQVTDGIFNLMKNLGIWAGPVKIPREVKIADCEEKIEIVNSKVAGLFVAEVQCGEKVSKNQIIGKVINPLEGKILEEVCASSDGLLFTLREYPIVEIGSLIGRIFK